MKNITLSALMFALLITSCRDNQKDPDTNSDSELNRAIENKEKNKDSLSLKNIESDIKQMLEQGNTTEEISAFISSKMTREDYEKIKNSLDNSIKSEGETQILNGLNNPNSKIRIEILKDTEREVAKFIKDPRFIELNNTNKINALREFKIQLFKIIQLDFNLNKESDILRDIMEEPFKKALKKISKNNPKD